MTRFFRAFMFMMGDAPVKTVSSLFFAVDVSQPPLRKGR
jgi:hypothetical protein